MGKKRILVVDNSKLMIKLMTTFLEKEGHEVVGVEDAFDALDILRKFSPQIIYLDLVMPRIGGDNLCKIFRTIPLLTNCYIAIISAAAVEQPIDFLQIGADACIAKGPFSQMRQHILETITESDALRHIPANSKTRGLENLFSRQITKELLSQNKDLKVILESISQGVVVIADNRVFYANAAALFILQVTMERLFGSYLDEILDSSTWERLTPYIESGIADAPVKEENAFIIIHDRHVVPQCLKMQEDGRNQIILLTDITDFKKTKSDLIQAEERWKTTFDAMVDPVALISADGTLERCNQAFATFLGEDTAFLQGNKCYRVVHKTKTFFPECPLLRARKSKRREEMEFPFGEKTYLVTVDPLQSADGRVNGFVHILRDITEQKQAVAVAHRFELLVNHSRDIIFFMRRSDLRIMEANEAATRAYGYSHEELLTMTIHQLRAPETLDLISDQMEQADMRGILIETVHRRSDGSTFPVEVSSRGESIDGTRTLISVVRDITERKRAEESVRLSEERFRKIFEESPLGIAFLGRQREIFLTNQSYRDFLGYSEAEIIQRGPAGLLHPDDLAASLETSTRLRSGEIPLFHMEQRYIRKDGAVVWADTRITVLRDKDGRLVHTIGWVLDITNRKLAEEALKRSEERLRQIARCVPDLIWTLDLSGRFTYVNSAVERLQGWTVEEFLRFSFQDTVTPRQALKDAAMIEEELARTTTPGYSRNWVRTFESEKLRKDGSIFLAEVSATFLWSDDGKPIGIIGTTRDISERKRVEEEKLQLQGQLLHSQKMESVGRLAGGVAHDFNNMLSVILGHAELALMRCSPAEPIHGDLKAIQDSALRSADLTRQLLAFARKQTVAPKILDLNNTVESMLKMLQRLIGEDIDLIWHPEAEQLSVRMDPSQIDQLLVNLCVNARDAIDAAGRVTIETGKEVFDEIYCDLHSGFFPGEYVVLAVSDNGRGMDRETCDHIFEPFFTTKQVGEGTGLGLATVYGIVKQNDGFVHVRSDPGQGTTFEIYLPRHTFKAERLPKGDEVRPANHGHEIILLVEDQPMILDMIMTMLKPYGYTVLCASSPSEAIRLVEGHIGEIHLLLTDVVMPGINGPDLSKRLLLRYPNLKSLFMSGHSADIIAHRGVLEVGVHFIQKPFTIKALTTKIREILDEDPL